MAKTKAEFEASDEGLEDMVSSLRDYLDGAPSIRKRKAKKLRELIDAPDSEKRTRRLMRLRNHVVAHCQSEGMLAEGEGYGKIDWANIPWDKILDFIMKLLPIIMALIPKAVLIALGTFVSAGLVAIVISTAVILQKFLSA